ncbi:hypothetical protein [Bradyrhizobium japonicum]|uniref:hypothetical protein n=1 Tax=Bradyrhizobium japonicum TaxID=375 RepID=UPI00200DD1B8|nr:hypothetical protein [Bradyrhizobium japonicum]UQD96073.1 hypothetical protein JEY30_31520 [Bradyrhizobium japonicum]
MKQLHHAAERTRNNRRAAMAPPDCFWRGLLPHIPVTVLTRRVRVLLLALRRVRIILPVIMGGGFFHFYSAPRRNTFFLVNDGGLKIDVPKFRMAATRAPLYGSHPCKAAIAVTAREACASRWTQLEIAPEHSRAAKASRETDARGQRA